MKNRICVVIVIFFSATFAMSSALAAKAANITLLYTGNLNGELEPCGCTREGDLGGIRRRATIVAQLRRQSPDLFLISSGGLLAIDSAADRIKNKYILKGIYKLGYDAIGVQSRDLLFGSELLMAEPLPWVASNRQYDQFKPSRRITHGQVSMRFFSWERPPDEALSNMHAKTITQKQSLALMYKEMQQARQQGELVVLAVAQPLAEIKRQIRLADVDILLIEARDETYGPPQQLGQTLILQPGTRGMRLGKVEIQLDEHRRITSYRQQIIPLPTTIAESADYADWYEDYNAELKADYLKRAALRKATETGQSPYAGADKCQTCHRAAWQSWQKSRHARALDSLKRVNKAFDPNCIGCHSVGFEQPGGYIDEFISGHLMHVQCESCHGAASDHVASNGKRPTAHKGWPKEKICRQCHIGSHSPAFTLRQYWPKVAH